MTNADQADRVVALMTQARAICAVVEVAMHEGGSGVDPDHVRYAVAGAGTIIERASDIAGFLGDELRDAGHASQEAVRS